MSACTLLHSFDCFKTSVFAQYVPKEAARAAAVACVPLASVLTKVEVAAKQLLQALQAGDAWMMGVRSAVTTLAGSDINMLTLPMGATVAGNPTLRKAPEESCSGVMALRTTHLKSDLGVRSGCVQLTASPAMVTLASRTLPVLLAVKVHSRLAAAAKQKVSQAGQCHKLTLRHMSVYACSSRCSTLFQYWKNYVVQGCQAWNAPASILQLSTGVVTTSCGVCLIVKVTNGEFVGCTWPAVAVAKVVSEVLPSNCSCVSLMVALQQEHA
jgi:hypothetical protein